MNCAFCITPFGRDFCFARHNKQAHSALACRKNFALDKVAKGGVADGD